MLDTMLLPTVLAFLMAFCAVSWVYFKILKIALDKNLVDNPDARKLQTRPVPVMGGIAVFFGVLAGVLAGAAWHALTLPPAATRLLPVVCALSVMLYMGAMDDVLGLTPRSRLVVEVLTLSGLVAASGMCVDDLHGLWGVGTLPWWTAVPLTVFAGVGVINAVNMIDGVNGLSSGLCMACCCFFGLAFVRTGDQPNAVLAFATTGALAPFFIHNVFGLRSRMFIGDSGTMVMGMLLAWFVICLLDGDGPASAGRLGVGHPVAMALAVLSVPVADTLRVMGMRMARGVSPFHPDKTHLHHVFVEVGVSHFITAMSEIAIGLMVVGAWAVSVRWGLDAEGQLYVVVGASACLVWGTYGLLRYHARRHTEFLHRLTALSVKTHLGRKDWWRRLTEWLDTSDLYPAGELGREEWREQLARRFRHSGPEYVHALREESLRRMRGFLKGRAEVLVSDLTENSGADRGLVAELLVEEIAGGRVVVRKASPEGLPAIVSWVDERQSERPENVRLTTEEKNKKTER